MHKTLAELKEIADRKGIEISDEATRKDIIEVLNQFDHILL